MNTKVLIVLVAVVTSAFALLISSQQAQAKDRSERAEERAERKAEKAEEKAERRAEKIEERREKRAEKREEKAEERARKKRSERRAESAKEQSGETGSESRSSGALTLKIQGAKGTEFSGTCTVGSEEHDVSGQVPQSFEYSLDGEKLECEIRNQNADAGALKIVLVGDGIHAVQQISSGGTVSLTYDGNSISSSTSSSGSTSTASSSSSVSSR